MLGPCLRIYLRMGWERFKRCVSESLLCTKYCYCWNLQGTPVHTRKVLVQAALQTKAQGGREPGSAACFVPLIKHSLVVGPFSQCIGLGLRLVRFDTLVAFTSTEQNTHLSFLMPGKIQKTQGGLSLCPLIFVVGCFVYKAHWADSSFWAPNPDSVARSPSACAARPCVLFETCNFCFEEELSFLKSSHLERTTHQMSFYVSSCQGSQPVIVSKIRLQNKRSAWCVISFCTDDLNLMTARRVHLMFKSYSVLYGRMEFALFLHVL